MRTARALEVRSQAIAEFFVCEVLEQQPPEMAQFMLDTSILGELTADTCAAVTGRPDAAALLRAVGMAHLFLVALDDEQTSFRYHHLVRQLLRAELHPGTRPASRSSSCGRPNGSRPRVTPGVLPATTLPPGRRTGRWLCWRTKSCPTSWPTRHCQHPWI